MTTNKGGRPPTGTIAWRRDKDGVFRWHARISLKDGSRPFVPLDPAILQSDEAAAKKCSIETAKFYRENVVTDGAHEGVERLPNAGRSRAAVSISKPEARQISREAAEVAIRMLYSEIRKLSELAARTAIDTCLAEFARLRSAYEEHSGEKVNDEVAEAMMRVANRKAGAG